MKIDKAVQCTPSTVMDEGKQFSFHIGVNRDIYIVHDSKTGKITFETKSEDGKVNKRRTLALSPQSWSLFCDHLTDIEEAVMQVEDGEENLMYKLHLGNLVFVTVQSNYRMVDLRTWFVPRQAEENPSLDSLKPGIPGIALKLPEFRNVLQNLTDIHKSLGIELVEPCVFTHENQEAAVACTVCNSKGLFY